ncbi:GNAT family N-acetyltransferase [Natrononativus amylolyticus]|uniref:GNAT family N-acetyltransferase n=1 Tax=Natrononativus amylolyticus TaxID=2963434 RepID=UPI0020CD013B|nr:GNAT family N-acetyltransferase [Natrononativus amylolyticus]
MTDSSPRLATTDDYPRITELIDRYFAYERDGMAARLPFCYDPDRPERHAVVEVDGRIASHIAAVPQTLAVGDDTVECWGIGGVATDRRYRGNGYMSDLLEFWLDRMADEGVPLSELSGNRQRYGHFGYERAGIEHRYPIDERSFAGTPAAADDGVISVYDGDADRLSTLRELHEREPYRVVRDRELSEITFGQRGLETLCYDGPEGPAYLSLSRESRSRTVREFGGSRGGVETLLAHVLAVYDLNELTVCVHPRHPLDSLFHEHSRYWSQRPHRLLNVRSLEGLFESFESQLEANWRESGRTESGSLSLGLAETGEAVEIAYGPGELSVDTRADTDPDLTLDRLSMTTLLFGFHEHMRETKLSEPVLAAALPLQFYIWPTEHV